MTYFNDVEIANGEVDLNGRRELYSEYKEMVLVMYPGQRFLDPLLADDPLYANNRRALATVGGQRSPQYEFQLELIVLPYQCTGI